MLLRWLFFSPFQTSKKRKKNSFKIDHQTLATHKTVWESCTFMFIQSFAPPFRVVCHLNDFHIEKFHCENFGRIRHSITDLYFGVCVASSNKLYSSKICLWEMCKKRDRERENGVQLFVCDFQLIKFRKIDKSALVKSCDERKNGRIERDKKREK